MEDFQCKVLAWEDDGIPEALRQVWMTFRAKYWNGKTTVPQKFFLANMENPQSKEMAWGESKQSIGMGRQRYPRSSSEIRRVFRARYWHGKDTLPGKLFSNTEDPKSKVLAHIWENDSTREALRQHRGSSEQRPGMAKRRYPRRGPNLAELTTRKCRISSSPCNKLCLNWRIAALDTY